MQSDMEVLPPHVSSSRRRTVTLADVAQRAGVSKVAVSVALNPSRSASRVSEATRERVRQAARELDYQPNGVAQSLRRRSTNTFGFFYYPESFDSLRLCWGDFLGGLASGCREMGKNLMLPGCLGNGDETQVLHELLGSQLDGLVVYAERVTPLIESLVDSELPCVIVGTLVPGLPCIIFDEKQSASSLIRHLRSRGHRRIAYCVAQRMLPPRIASRLATFAQEANLQGLCFRLEDTNAVSGPLSHQMTAHPRTIAIYSDFAEGAFIDCGSMPPRLAMPVPLMAGFPWEFVGRQSVSLLLARREGQTVPAKTLILPHIESREPLSLSYRDSDSRNR